MQRGAKKIKGITLLFVFCMIFSAYESGHAFIPRSGEVITKVNLRKSPGMEGKIITSLEKGEAVLIMEKDGGWYKVIIDDENYGYKGWVYGTFLKEDKKAEKDMSPASIKPIIEISLEDDLDKKLDKREEKSTQISKRHNEDAPLQKKIFSVGEIDKQKRQDVRPKEAILKESLKGIPFKEEEKPRQFPVMSLEKVSHKERLPFVGETKKIRPQDICNNEEPPVFFQWIKKVLGFLLRISSVIFSCLALVFSLKAFKLAKICSEIVTKYRHNP